MLQPTHASNIDGRPDRIVVRGPNWLGDHVMAGPFYSRVADLYPQAERVLVIPEHLIHLPYPEYFTSVVGLTVANRKTLAGIWSFAGLLKKRSLTVAFVLPTSWRSALPFAVAGIPRRIGFASSLNAWLLHDRVRWNGVQSGIHKSDLYLTLLSAGGSPPLSSSGWPGRQAAVGNSEPVVRENTVIIAPGASIALREWPFYADFVRAFRAKFPDYRLLVVGTATEKRVVQLARDLAPYGVEDQVGNTTLPQLIGLCRAARLVIANDSGVAHLAASMAESPTIVLFGPGDPSYVKPRGGGEVHVVRNPALSCSPCESAICRQPFGYQTCLKTISVEQVMNAAETVLGNRAASVIKTES